jgi:hypothetical protein
MTLIADFHLFKQNHDNVWINEKNVGFYLLRKERVGPLLMVDSVYYYLFSHYAVNYKWMEQYEKDLGPALEISMLIGQRIYQHKMHQTSALVVSIFDKSLNKSKFLYKQTADAFRCMDKKRLWFGDPISVGFLPLSEFTTEDPLN